MIDAVVQFGSAVSRLSDLSVDLIEKSDERSVSHMRRVQSYLNLALCELSDIEDILRDEEDER